MNQSNSKSKSNHRDDNNNNDSDSDSDNSSSSLVVTLVKFQCYYYSVQRYEEGPWRQWTMPKQNRSHNKLAKNNSNALSTTWAVVCTTSNLW